LKFIGEEVIRDDPLRNWLRDILLVQKRKSINNMIVGPSSGENKMPECFHCSNKIDSKIKENIYKFTCSVSAIVITILVAAGVGFSGENLDHLCFRGANLRNGLFCSTSFEGSCLRDCNLRHAYVGGALFRFTDLRNIDLGIFPEKREGCLVSYSLDWTKLEQYGMIYDRFTVRNDL
jgi:hypothetical protein